MSKDRVFDMTHHDTSSRFKNFNCDDDFHKKVDDLEFNDDLME